MRGRNYLSERGGLSRDGASVAGAGCHSRAGSSPLHLSRLSAPKGVETVGSGAGCAGERSIQQQQQLNGEVETAVVNVTETGPRFNRRKTNGAADAALRASAALE
ncbi:hypothetical protein AAFF_G00004450 [Aldrovandia affinis]|uniref:Uncharacterized protein n=1 Tax=Aldrovandia affinis TaxID=143900 RepID=A0AAD7X2U7_9TELE|nr:hypothetical protein AAFF_G00004450 [Aldrovandia affinis]